MSEVERKRSAKKLFERACKLERGYNYLFTDVIRLDEDDWLLKVHTTISDQQNGLVWVSEKVGSACEDDDSEYDEHNDDRNVFELFCSKSEYRSQFAVHGSLVRIECIENFNKTFTCFCSNV